MIILSPLIMDPAQRACVVVVYGPVTLAGPAIPFNDPSGKNHVSVRHVKAFARRDRILALKLGAR